jgi:hypothetical protein
LRHSTHGYYFPPVDVFDAQSSLNTAVDRFLYLALRSFGFSFERNEEHKPPSQLDGSELKTSFALRILWERI